MFEQLSDGRNKRLVNTLIYIDPKGNQWIAPKGSVVDGASIPKLLWSSIGSPFTGKYLAASVIHDVACKQKVKPWEAVHRVFYDAMLASGVDSGKAKLMYAAVHQGGPRWGDYAENPLSEAELKKFILNPETENIENLSTLGKLKPYSGATLYMGTKTSKNKFGMKKHETAKPVLGIIKSIGDFKISYETDGSNSSLGLRFSLGGNSGGSMTIGEACKINPDGGLCKRFSKRNKEANQQRINKNIQSNDNKGCKPIKDQSDSINAEFNESRKHIGYNSPVKFDDCNTKIAGEEQDAAAKKLFGE